MTEITQADRDLLAGQCDCFGQTAIGHDIRNYHHTLIDLAPALSAITEALTRAEKAEGERDEAISRLCAAGMEPPTAEDMQWASDFVQAAKKSGDWVSPRDREIDDLQAENKRLREALERIISHATTARAADDIALAALKDPS